MANIVFPVKCTGYLDITTSYGHPYPTDTKLHATEFYAMVEITKLFNRYKNNQNILNQAGINNLNSFFTRVAFLNYIYNSNNSNLVQEKNLLKRLMPSLLKEISFHPGIDINKGAGNADVGEPVYAVFDGKVIRANEIWSAGSGGFVVLYHETGSTKFYTLYGHVVPEVTAGFVKRGQRIARIASISNFPAHLHFEVSLRDVYSNARRAYPGYPYKQKRLNVAYLAAYHYQNLNAYLTNGIMPSYFSTPNEFYYMMIVDPQNPFPPNLDTVEVLNSYSVFTKSYGFVDPIEFLSKISCGKLYNPPNGVESKQVCTNVNKQVEREVVIRR